MPWEGLSGKLAADPRIARSLARERVAREREQRAEVESRGGSGGRREAESVGERAEEESRGRREG